MVKMVLFRVGLFPPRVQEIGGMSSVMMALLALLHQLMKYKECRWIYANLHLPLDSRVSKNLGSRRWKEYKSLFPEEIIKKYFDSTEGKVQSAYSLSYDDYKKIQDALKDLVKKLNNRPGVEYKLKSRIELNMLLWA